MKPEAINAPDAMGFRTAGALALLTAGLFAAGILLEDPVASAPRINVLNGDVTVNGRPGRLEECLAVGESLAVGEGGAALIRYGDGSSIKLGAKTGGFAVAGGRDGSRSLRLVFGQLQACVPEGAPAVEIASDLGKIRTGGATFDFSVSPILTGAAIDTPRILSLAVARGSVTLELPKERGGQRVVIPSGLSVRRIEGVPCAEEPRPLLSIDNTTPADKVPPGVWAPRWPGRNGPTPGSRRGVAMAWSRGLSGAVLFGGRSDDAAAWCYDAPADRWRRLAGLQPSVGGQGAVISGFEDGAPRSIAIKSAPFPVDGVGHPACWDSRRERVLLLQAFPDGAPSDARAQTWSYLPASGTWTDLGAQGAPGPGLATGAMAYSAKADAVLLYGVGPGNAETWVYRCAANRWERLRPVCNPPPRSGHALCYDPSADLFVIYGGQGIRGALDDTWVFRLQP